MWMAGPHVKHNSSHWALMSNISHLTLHQTQCIQVQQMWNKVHHALCPSIFQKCVIGSSLIHIGNNVADPYGTSFLPLESNHQAHLRRNFALPVLAMCT